MASLRFEFLRYCFHFAFFFRLLSVTCNPTIFLPFLVPLGGSSFLPLSVAVVFSVGYGPISDRDSLPSRGPSLFPGRVAFSSRPSCLPLSTTFVFPDFPPLNGPFCQFFLFPVSPIMFTDLEENCKLTFPPNDSLLFLKCPNLSYSPTYPGTFPFPRLVLVIPYVV